MTMSTPRTLNAVRFGVSLCIIIQLDFRWNSYFRQRRFSRLPLTMVFVFNSYWNACLSFCIINGFSLEIIGVWSSSPTLYCFRIWNSIESKYWARRGGVSPARGGKSINLALRQAQYWDATILQIQSGDFCVTYLGLVCWGVPSPAISQIREADSTQLIMLWYEAVGESGTRKFVFTLESFVHREAGDDALIDAIFLPIPDMLFQALPNNKREHKEP